MGWRVWIDVGFICFSLFSIKTTRNVTDLVPKKQHGVLPTPMSTYYDDGYDGRASPTTKKEWKAQELLSDERN